MKNLFLLMMATISLGAHAGIVETVLWEDTYSEGIELSQETVASFAAGNVLRVYVTVPDGGANFKIVYKGESNGWSESTIPSIDSQWPWVNGGDTYKDFTFTDADITALAGMNIYIYKGDNSTVSKVGLLQEVEEAVAEAEKVKWTGSEAISWDGEIPGTQYEAGGGIFSGLKSGDVVRIYSSLTEGDYGDPQYVVTYKKGQEWAWTDLATTVTDGVIKFSVEDETMATEIAERGLVLRGKAWTATKITVNDFTSIVLKDTEMPIVDAGSYGQVKVNRTLLAGFNTIILPFATTAAELTGSDVAYAAKIKAANEAGDELTFVKVDAMETNKPYLIYVEAETSIATLSNKGLVALGNSWDWQIWDYAETPTRWYMQGVYEPASAEGKYVVSGENSLAVGSSSATINGLRAYITTQSGEVKGALRIAIDDIETGIREMVVPEQVHGLIFNAAGQRMSRMQRGVNIVGGKTVLVK